MPVQEKELYSLITKFIPIGDYHAKVVATVAIDPATGGPPAPGSGMAVREVAGSGAVEYITSTAVKVGTWKQVHCLTDTVFSVFSRTGATGSITGITLPAGTLLIGPVTAITLTSGAVAAYA